MNQYDIALKNLFQRQFQTGFLARLTDQAICEWLPNELPEVRTRHVDLLGRTASGELIHIEFQSRNHPRMALRMAEYALAIYRRHRTMPRQIVVYVGARPLRMPAMLPGPGWAYQCRIVDIREIPTEDLLGSPHLEDNILAVLTRLADSGETIRQILQRIGAGPREQRQTLLAELLLLAGLRQLEVIMKRELEQMSVLIDINRHTIFGPIHREGVRQGVEQGIAKGVAKGTQDLVLHLLAQRFGAVDAAHERRIRAMEVDEIQALSSRLLSAVSLEELLGTDGN